MAHNPSLRKLIVPLLDYVEPTARWCGTEGCLHRNYEHALDNHCLICSCEHFSERTYGEDMETIMRFVEERAR